MAKAPRPGWSKTRLAPRLGLRGAARVQHILIAQRIELAASLGYPCELHASPNLNHGVFLQAKRLGIAVRHQFHGHLGQRMARAQAGRGSVIIGTDSPALGAQQINKAMKIVADGGHVCVPATDGGYVLIGSASPQARLYQTINWGSNRVMRQTLKQQRRCQQHWHVLSAHADLDTPADYKKQRKCGLLPAYGKRPFPAPSATQAQKNSNNASLLKKNRDTSKIMLTK